MPLQDEYVNSGNWLFKYRGILPMVFLMPALIFIIINPLYFFSTRSHWIFICLGISLFGELIRIFTVGFVPIGTSGRNTKSQSAKSLNTTGIYSLIRHPLYLGNYFIWSGFIIFFNNAWLFVIITLVYFLYYERIMFAEENFLNNKFGDEYTNWAKITPAVIPALSRYISSNNTFSIRTILLREYTGIAGIIIVFSLLNGFQSYCEIGKFLLSIEWKYLTTFGLFI